MILYFIYFLCLVCIFTSTFITYRNIQDKKIEPGTDLFVYKGYTVRYMKYVEMLHLGKDTINACVIRDINDTIYVNKPYMDAPEEIQFTILEHEIGHFVWDHLETPQIGDRSLQKEQEADMYASRVVGTAACIDMLIYLRDEKINKRRALDLLWGETHKTFKSSILELNQRIEHMQNQKESR